MVHFKVNLFEGHLKFSRTILYQKTPFKPSEWGTGKKSWVLLYFIFKIYPWIRGTRNTGKWNWTPAFWISKAKKFNKKNSKANREVNPGLVTGQPFLHYSNQETPWKHQQLTWSRWLLPLLTPSALKFLSIEWSKLVGERNKHSYFVGGRIKEGSLVSAQTIFNHFSLFQSLPMCHTALIFRKVVVYQTLSGALTWPSNFTRLSHPD